MIRIPYFMVIFVPFVSSCKIRLLLQRGVDLMNSVVNLFQIIKTINNYFLLLTNI